VDLPGIRELVSHIDGGSWLMKLAKPRSGIGITPRGRFNEKVFEGVKDEGFGRSHRE
jgi:hypothetical protein